MEMHAAADERVDPIRVVIVDDAEDLRFLLRLQFRRDARFTVVGEASDGNEAIALAEREQPDLMILDRQMPNLGGLEAMPEIRRVSPETAIILYTANADPNTVQAALDAGGVHVLEKAGGGGHFVENLVHALTERSTDEATVAIRVGPAPSGAACLWVANSLEIIDAVVAHPEVLGAPIPDDVIDLFRSMLDQWAAVAETSEEFRWVARARPDDVRRIVENWAAIDAMTDSQLDALGVHWAPDEAQPFFVALTNGVLDALHRVEHTDRMIDRLRAQWEPYRAYNAG